MIPRARIRSLAIEAVPAKRPAPPIRLGSIVRFPSVHPDAQVLAFPAGQAGDRDASRRCTAGYAGPFRIDLADRTPEFARGPALSGRGGRRPHVGEYA